MILIDTNVVSELMRKSPEPPVEAWVEGHPVEELFFSAIGEAELRYGVAVMPVGRRRDALASDIESMLRAAFEGRILPFDSEAAHAYAEVASARRAAGRPVPMADCTDRCHRAFTRHGGGDAQRPGFCRYGDCRHRPVGTGA